MAGKGSSDVVKSGADALSLIWGKDGKNGGKSLNDSLVMDAAGTLESIGGTDGVRVGKVIKLERGQGLGGEFLGYVEFRGKAKDGKGEGDGKYTSHWVGLECDANGLKVTVYHPGTAQIMQQLQQTGAQPGDRVAIFRPDVDPIPLPDVAPDAEVIPFDVVVKPANGGGRLAFSAKPTSGKWAPTTGNTGTPSNG